MAKQELEPDFGRAERSLSMDPAQLSITLEDFSGLTAKPKTVEPSTATKTKKPTSPSLEDVVTQTPTVTVGEIEQETVASEMSVMTDAMYVTTDLPHHVPPHLAADPVLALTVVLSFLLNRPS